MCYVRILILTGHGLDHEEDNSRQEKGDSCCSLSATGISQRTLKTRDSSPTKMSGALIKLKRG